MKKILCLFSTLLMITTSLLSPLAQASELSAALNKCRQQHNSVKRLLCYDEINLQLTTHSAATPAPADHTARQSATSLAQQTAVNRSTVVAGTIEADEDFGLEHKKIAEKRVDQLYVTVSNISYSPHKELIVEFDNGQIWRQSDNGYYKIAVGEQHYIKRGMFNSFRLGNDDNNRTVKVRRVD